MPGLEQGIHAGIVHRPARRPDRAVHKLHGRVVANDGDGLGHQAVHRLKRDALVGLKAANESSVVLPGEQSLGDHDIEVHAQRDQAHGCQQHDRLESQHTPQGPGVETGDQVKRELEPAISPRQIGVVRLEEQRAHHRGRCERDHQREADGDRQGHGKLVEQPPHQPAHEQDGNEHRDERQADRENGEANFPSANQSGLERAGPAFAVPGNVLHHDDRIVDNEPRGDRERDHRQIVDAEPDEIHHAKTAQQRDGNGHTGDQCRPPVPQKQIDHRDHQRHGNGNGHLNFVNGGPHRGRPVDGDGEVDVRGDLGREDGNERPHAIGHINDVGVGLTKHFERDRGQFVEIARGTDVVDRFRHAGDIANADRSAVFPGKNQLFVVPGSQ